MEVAVQHLYDVCWCAEFSWMNGAVHGTPFPPTLAIKPVPGIPLYPTSKWHMKLHGEHGIPG